MSTAERIPLEDAPPPRAVVRRVEAALADGGLVSLPTETVYGIAARADHAGAIEALRALKGRAPSLALTWHVASRDALQAFPRLRPLARRLAALYWPGPLTLVLDGVPTGLELAAADGATGVRFPAHQGTAGLIAALPFPVVLSSANRSGEPPLGEARAIGERFGAQLALVLDGGRPRLGEASAVLRLGLGRFELMREGLMSLEELRRAAGLSIAFCCTGNTCRSPMAEGLAKLALARRLGVPDRSGSPRSPGSARSIRDFGFEVHSMGVAAAPGAGAAEHAVSVLAAEGYDLSSHASTPATIDAIAACDRVYGLTPSHLEALRALLPPSKARAVELLDPDGEPIPDPIGGPIEVYRRTAEAIRVAIERRLGDWA